MLIGNPFIGLFINLAATFLIYSYSKGFFYHPAAWGSLFISTYNLSIVILHFLGLRVVKNLNELVLINLIALAGFLLPLLLLTKSGGLNLKWGNNASTSLSKALLVIFYGVTFLVCLDFVSSGASVKSQYDSKLLPFFNIANFYAALYICFTWGEKENSHIFLGFSFLYLLFASLLLGERNVFFSYMALVTVLVFVFNPGKVSWGYLISFAVILLIPILGEYKNFFTRSSFNEIEFSNIFIDLLNGEFRSAGFNIDVILNNFRDYKYGSSIVGDLLRSLVPGFVYDFQNSVGWYNNEYHPHLVEIGRGYGFSLAAEGYINFLISVFLYGF